jgi:hypothetical protein
MSNLGLQRLGKCLNAVYFVHVYVRKKGLLAFVKEQSREGKGGKLSTEK